MKVLTISAHHIECSEWLDPRGVQEADRIDGAGAQRSEGQSGDTSIFDLANYQIRICGNMFRGKL